MTIPEEFQVVSQLFYDAVHAVMHGDAAPMLALWSESDDVTYCDPYGRFHQGREALVAYWQRAAYVNSQSPGSVSVKSDLMMTQRNGEMVYMVMEEHIQIKAESGLLRQQALATNIFRYEGAHWRMTHRHAGTPSEEAE